MTIPIANGLRRKSRGRIKNLETLLYVTSHDLREPLRAIRSLTQLLSERIAETQAVVEIVGELPQIRVDPRWLRQSLFNLVGNALKFCRDGEPPHVETAACVPESKTVAVTGLVVRDRGPGIAPEHVEQVFQGAVGSRMEGAGAGLAIVRQISTRYGGEAWYETRPAGGSQLVITFGTGSCAVQSTEVGIELWKLNGEIG